MLLCTQANAAVFDLTLSDFFFDDGDTVSPSSISFQAQTNLAAPVFLLDYFGTPPVVEITAGSAPSVTLDGGLVADSVDGAVTTSGFIANGSAELGFVPSISMVLSLADIQSIDSLAVGDTFSILGVLIEAEIFVIRGEGLVLVNNFGTVNFSGTILEATPPAPPSAVIPLPASLPLALAGFGALGLLARRRKASC